LHGGQSLHTNQQLRTIIRIALVLILFA
jgi:hypothetical protein